MAGKSAVKDSWTTLRRGEGLGLEQGVMLLKGLEDGPPTGRAHTGENLGRSGISPHLAYLTLPLPLRGESPQP